MSQDEFKVKVKRVHKYLVDQGYEAMVLGRPRNFSWLLCGPTNTVDTGSEVGVGLLKVGARDTTLITTNIEETRMREEVVGDLPIEIIGVPWHESGALAAVLRQDKRARRLVGDIAVPGAGIAQAGRPFWTMQVPLLPAEIERYRSLGADAVASVEDVCRRVEPGWTEREIFAHVAQMFYACGIRPLVLLVGADQRIVKYRHPVPTGARIQRHGMIVVCAERDGLVANLTRTVHFGPVPEDLQRRHRAAAEVEAALVAATQPDTALGAILQAGIAAYAQQGFPEEWRNHHQGGTTGYNTRDVVATPDSTERIVEGQAVAWNPSVPGAKSEDTFLITADGPVCLTESPNWPLIEVGPRDNRLRRPAILER